MTRVRAVVLAVLLALLAGALWLRGLPMGDPDLGSIRLPSGFRITYFARELRGARSLVVGARGTVFVGTRGEDVVYALRDPDGDGVADSVYRLGGAFDAPNGVAFRDGTLFVADIARIWRFDAIEDRLAAPPAPVLVTDGLPREGWHGLRYIAFGPDGLLYVGSGVPCNVCQRDDERFATILRVHLESGSVEVFARGVRNSVGFDWHPETGELWFTDNGRDWMGPNQPWDELNRAPGAGLHFGFPFCHGGDLQDSEFTARPCSDFTPPAAQLDAHVAPLGMRFYTGTQFPLRYRGRIFIAEHGSWNRLIPVGYRITTVRFDSDAPRYEVFARGWLSRMRRNASGRPVDLVVMPDGALLVSDDAAGVVYRINYGP